MYKKAAQQHLRFDTDKGRVTVEDLFKLNLQQLNEIGKALRKVVKESEEESLIGDTCSSGAEEAKLKFDIVVDVISTKKAEYTASVNASANKAIKQELLAELEARQKDHLKSLSEDEIRAKLAALV